MFCGYDRGSSGYHGDSFGHAAPIADAEADPNPSFWDVLDGNVGPSDFFEYVDSKPGCILVHIMVRFLGGSRIF